jgi:RNA polymerase primary sigma factor
MTETAALLARAQAGDRRAEDRLIRENEALCLKVASKYVGLARGRLPAEDVIQEARLGLLAAVRGFDLGRGLAFSTYAVVSMERHCRRAIANSDPIRVPLYAQAAGSKPAEILSLDCPVGEEDVSFLGEALPAAEDTEQEAIAGVWVAQLLARLEPRQRTAIELHILEERSLEEVGASLGMSREGSRQLAKRGLCRLAGFVE